MQIIEDTDLPGIGPITACTGGNRIFGMAAMLCFCACLARAGEPPSVIPIHSSPDGTRAWVEVTRSGNRTKAAPFFDIPGETVQGMSAAADAGSGLIDPGKGEETGSGHGKVDIGDFLKRRKSMVFREGPEGVSLGNALDLVGEIRDALERGKTRSEQVRAVSNVLLTPHSEEESGRPTTGVEETPVTEPPSEPLGTSTLCVRCSLGRN